MNSRECIFLIATYYMFALSCAGPIETKEKKGLDEKDVIYVGQHEITKIYTSLVLMEELQKRIVFFVETDENKHGSKVDKGLYVIVENSTTKLLENGKDIAGDATGEVFFATNEGVYTYNSKENNAYKYGHLADSIISLAVENNTGVVYALTENHTLFKLTDKGRKCNIDERVKNAREITLDTFDNLYYYDDDTKLHVIVDQHAKKIDGLPNNATNTKLIKLPFGNEGICFIVDDEVYIVFPNGTSIKTENKFITRGNTAYSFDAMVVLYVGHEKKIYEINLIAKIITGIFDGLSKWVKKHLIFGPTSF